MCFEPDSIPPIPVVTGASIDHEDLVLQASDGTAFSAFVARAEGTPTSGVVILPDVRGLYRFYEELALRFAERGIDAIAIDYFGRTAGTGKRTNDWEYMPHVDQVTEDGLRADVAAAIDELGEGRSLDSIFTVGFCFGGSNSWHQAANGLGLSGAIGFYGNPTRPNRPLGAAPVVDRVGSIDCPILALMAGDDAGIPPESVEAFRDALDEAGVVNDVVVYEGAPHSFFDRKYETYGSESADSWERVLAFIDANG